MDRRILFEKSVKDTDNGYIRSRPEDTQAYQRYIPAKYRRKELPLPMLGELDVVRHFTNLSRRNFSVDTHFYPLGSCTMKYNPKINENAAGLPGFSNLHPFQSQESVQGALSLLYQLEEALCAITGMSRYTFQAAAGAQGELVGMQIIKAYHDAQRQRRSVILVPDSAHGTNPATAHMCGYTVKVIKSTSQGLVDVAELAKAVDGTCAGMMLTNPNTLGLFEEEILRIQDILHQKGALLYYDGANFNPLLAITKPSRMGFDIVHLNLHKTFSTPHGSGGPGAAAVGVTKKLVDYLPVPVISKNAKGFYLDYTLKRTIGRVKAFYGNFSVLVRAYAYIVRLGRDGLRKVAQNCVLNANYIKARLKDRYAPASAKPCMHEVVFSCAQQKAKGITALDIAKRLIDYGIHPPTMYFPLIIKEALMIEPTETESKATLDYFIQAMREIDDEISRNPEILKTAPHTTAIRRVDEVRAIRSPDLRWKESGA